MTATEERAVGARVERPRGMVVIGRRLALPMSRAALLVGVGIVLALVAAAVATLTMGRLGVPLGELPTALTGGAEGKSLFVLDRLRGPRLVVAIAAGAALGLSGALFQSVTRNPLGSPDVIGLSGGAGAGAAVVALKMPDVPVSLGALVGAAAAITLVYFSTGTGFRDPGRLIVAGIGVAAIALALTQYVVYAVERERATALTAYVNGSLAARSWEDARDIGLALLVLLPLTLALSRRLEIGEMGDEIAAALGAEPKRTRTQAVLLSVLLSAAAISVAGPIAFIALTAPQIARRLTGGSGAHLLLSALMGSLLLVLADLAAQQLPMDDMPVGIYTMAIGGIYLGYLLTREWRKGRL
ncbi:iron complex transport system permease protein [Streptomyces zhaozhouensis]|uniref:Iron complex transport system permease protein n=1 Tax=Streptomyces zhaozhouensis TaxID=1300267 RepID=A0A286DSS0_9ACTN|nr:iron chelate uptake ABC transporter family permease subunit [Streptomyces zhaozhouensis]SOD61698.1 iron complex transport system permease protein [Streptomyces zhaozhouensis]